MYRHNKVPLADCATIVITIESCFVSGADRCGACVDRTAEPAAGGAAPPGGHQEDEGGQTEEGRAGQQAHSRQVGAAR